MFFENHKIAKIWDENFFAIQKFQPSSTIKFSLEMKYFNETKLSTSPRFKIWTQ